MNMSLTAQAAECLSWHYFWAEPHLSGNNFDVFLIQIALSSFYVLHNDFLQLPNLEVGWGTDIVKQ